MAFIHVRYFAYRLVSRRITGSSYDWVEMMNDPTIDIPKQRAVRFNIPSEIPKDRLYQVYRRDVTVEQDSRTL